MVESKAIISSFGNIEDQEVHLISLSNKNNTRLEIITYGATWHGLHIQDKKGDFRNVVVAPHSLEDYHAQFNAIPYYFGATIGRYAGRISNSSFSIEQEQFNLSPGGKVHLHGGDHGVSQKIWKIEEFIEDEKPQVILSCQSKHLEGGYPGNLTIKVKYSLSDKDEVEIRYEVTTDKTTIVNLTNHIYFNLGDSSVLNQQLQLKASKILEVDDLLLPTGEFKAVDNSSYDFKKLRAIRQTEKIKGLDTTYVFDDNNEKESQILYQAPESDLSLKVFTNQPAVVVFVPEELQFAGSASANHQINYPSICFETQNLPDAPNHPHFPSAVLHPNQVYLNETKFQFNKI